MQGWVAGLFISIFPQRTRAWEVICLEQQASGGKAKSRLRGTWAASPPPHSPGDPRSAQHLHPRSAFRKHKLNSSFTRMENREHSTPTYLTPEVHCGFLRYGMCMHPHLEPIFSSGIQLLSESSIYCSPCWNLHPGAFGVALPAQGSGDFGFHFLNGKQALRKKGHFCWAVHFCFVLRQGLTM